MTEEQIENFAYDLIRFLKKWDLWQSVVVDCNGKRYSGYETSTYPCGLRDMPDIHVRDSNPISRKRFLRQGSDREDAAVLAECPGYTFYYLFGEHFCRLKLSNLSNDAKKYVIEKYELVEMALEDDDFPILDDTDFDSYDEYLEYELEMEDEWIESILSQLDDEEIDCGLDIQKHIIEEMEEVCQKHHMDYSIVGYFEGIAYYPADDNGAGEGDEL